MTISKSPNPPHIPSKKKSNIRIIKDIHRNLLATSVSSLTYPKRPQQTSDANPNALLRKRLAGADAAPPAERHVASFIRKWSALGAVIQEAPRIECVGVWELAFVMVDCPDVALDPAGFGDEVALAVWVSIE